MSSSVGYTDRVQRWRERLENCGELQLPTDYPRTNPLKIVEAEETLELPELSCLSILQLSLGTSSNQNNPNSPFVVLLSAFVVLLHRHTSQEDLLVGSSSTSFNPLILRLKIRPGQTFLELIEQVKQVETEAAQEEIPHDQLLNILNDLQAPFRVRFFNQTDTPDSTLINTLGNNDISVFIKQKSTQSLRQLLPSIQVKVSFNQLLFHPKTVSLWLKQLVKIIDNACFAYVNSKVSEIDYSIGSIDLLSPEENSTLLPNPDEDLHWDEWPGPITEIFKRNAKAHSSKRCIIESIPSEGGFIDRSFDYGQIYDFVNLVAKYLLSNGMQKEEIVCIYAHRCAELAIAIMGALTAGLTYCVIDPAYPPARQIVYLSVAQPKALIILDRAGRLHSSVSEFISETLPLKCEIPALRISDDGSLTSPRSQTDKDNIFNNLDTDIDILIGPDSIGTLSFTSGSTGVPKGVQGRHFSLTHFYPWMAQEFNLSSSDRFTMLSGIAHDPIQRDIFTPLFFGAEIYIPTAEDIGNPGQLASWMSKRNISITHLTPAMGQLLSSNATTSIPSLRNAFFVGDLLTKRDCLRLQRLASNTHIINMYGTTETQRAVSYFTIPPASKNPTFLESMKDIMPAGKGMRSAQMLIINPHSKRLCGVGEVGEIYLRSSGLSEGYLSLDEINREKFVLNWFASDKIDSSHPNIPFYKGKRDRLYRTGDLGRYTYQGHVECIGRLDDQVKIRGFRIELSEIDQMISQLASVHNNVTLVRRDKYEEKTLVTYFVPATIISSDINFESLIKEIRNHLKTKLPTHSVSSVYVPLNRLPLTPNGKIDKAALPFPDTIQARTRKDSSHSHTSFFTSTEKSLYHIWKELLQPSFKISLDDNFFDIGGHSILATRMLFSTRQLLKVDAPLNLVYKNPTIRSMAHELDILINGVLQPPLPSEETQTVPGYTSDFNSLRSRLPESGLLSALPRSKNNQSILLTGATGFLGVFILHYLLKQDSSSKIFCLVRPDNNISGKNRVVQALKDHCLYDPSEDDRIISAVGDLSKSRLGLSNDTWNELSNNIDYIIHNGALVHWVYPYHKLRPSNVMATLEIIQLATTNSIKPIFFVSSTSVLDTPYYLQFSEVEIEKGNAGILESDDLSGSQFGLKTGYAQSKWVAEKLLMELMNRGLPISIVRPGYIVGDSQSGVTNTDDFIWRLVKGCIELSSVPIMNNMINMCPVDYVARVIAQMALSASENHVYHITNPHPFRFDDLFHSLLRYGYELDSVAYMSWRDHLMNYTLNSNDSALYPLLHFVLDDLPTSTKAPRLADFNTQALLDGTSIRCPSIDEKLGLYLSYLVQVSFLPKPSNSDADPLPHIDISTDVILSRTQK